MALPVPTAHFTTFVQSMYDEGILDSQFAQIQALQDSSNPNFVNEVITLFCNDAERIITEMNNYLIHSNVDFSMLDSCVHQLKGSSSSIGANRMKLACIELRQASDDHNRDRCLQALNLITQEYCLLRNKFQTLIQLEKGISVVEANQK